MRRRWAHLSVFLLAAAYAVAGLPWLVTHGLLHHAHEHEEEAHHAAGQPEHASAGCAEEAAAVATLVHGHAHPDGVPEHAHGVSPSVSLRNDPPDLEHPTEAAPLRLVPLEETNQVSSEMDRRVSRAGVGPPSRPYSLCVLLI